MKNRKIGILGGSFDPVHMGHIRLAQSALAEYGLDEVWFVPVGHSPNKDEEGMTDAAARAGMVRLAIKPYPHFALCDIELAADRTSYTYQTLSDLSELYPKTQFYFILGADSLDYFEQWMHPEIICEKAILLAAVRGDKSAEWMSDKIGQIAKKFQAEIYPLYGGRTVVSSTTIRRAFADRDYSISYMLPEGVPEYIVSHGLYEKEAEL